MSFNQDDTPRNIEAEENFISICMKNNDAWFSEPVDARWFFDSKHSTIAFAMAKLGREGKPLDAAHIIEACLSYSSKGKDVIKAAGGEDYIRALQSKSVDRRQAKDLLKMISDASCSRMLMAAADKIRSLACSGESDPFSKISESIGILSNVKAKPTTESLIDVAQRYSKVLEERAETQKSGGIMTGFMDIDWHLKGLRKGSYNILAANSSAGKTAFQMQLLWQMSGIQDYKGFFASIEMNEEAVMDRLLSLVSRVPMDTITGGHGLKFHMKRINESLAKITRVIETKLVIDFADSMTPSEFRSKAEQAKIHLQGLDYGCADYLQFMSHEKKFSGRPELVQNISLEMKANSKYLNIPLWVLAQLNLEAAKADEPELWHIAESAQVWRDADLVFLMHTAQMRSDGNRNVIINLKKARNNALGQFKFTFVPSMQRFDPYDGVNEPGPNGKGSQPVARNNYENMVDEIMTAGAWDKL